MMKKNENQVAVILTDVTERKKTEKALIEKELKFEIVADFTYDWAYWIAPDGKLLYVSPSCERITGYLPNDFVNDPQLLEKIIHPKDEQFKKHLEIIEPSKVHQDSYQIITRGGEERWIEHLCQPVFGLKGEFLGRHASNRDITDRKKAEEASRLSEEKFSKVFKNGPNTVTITRLSDGKIIEANDSLISLLGYTPKEVIGKTTLELGMWAYPDDRKDLVKKLVANGLVTDCELVLMRKDGAQIIVNLSASLIEIQNEQCFLSSFIDITARKRAEKALNERNKELELLQIKLQEKAAEVQQYASLMEQLAEERLKKLKDNERLAAIGQTAGMVGHDIRNPLQAIVSDLYLAKQMIKDTPVTETRQQMEESLTQIEENVFYIDKIVSDLQDYTKPIKPNVQVVDITDLIYSTLVTANTPQTIETQVIVDEGLTINSDPAFLKRILTNLMINSVQAMPNGGKLTIQAHKEHDKIGISVQDTGIGIAEEIKPNLFKPLFTTKPKGQGLGLAVVKRLVEGLNGAVSFESQEGKGTKFTVELPLQN
jgi:PAS domain S-box-containing protein